MKKTAGQAERKEREEMKQVKSYTSIWNVEKVIHAVGDVNLPFPATITQIGYFTGTAVVCLMIHNLPPFVYKKFRCMGCDMRRKCVSDVKKEL